jgi:hypothetical protein
MGQRKRKKSPPLTTIYVGLKLFMWNTTPIV